MHSIISIMSFIDAEQKPIIQVDTKLTGAQCPINVEKLNALNVNTGQVSKKYTLRCTCTYRV